MTTLNYIKFESLRPSPELVKLEMESQTGLKFNLIEDGDNLFFLKNEFTPEDLLLCYTDPGVIIIDLLYVRKPPYFSSKLFVSLIKLGGRSNTIMPKYSKLTYEEAKMKKRISF